MKRKADNTAAFLQGMCARENVQEKDISLIRLYAKKTQDPDEWAAFFSSVRIEEESFPFNYMLSRLGARFDWNLVPEELVPRLQGLRKKAALENVLLFNRAYDVLRKLDQKKIPMMFIKGGALRFSLLPEQPRRMTDLDLLVPMGLYEESVRMGEESGLVANIVDHSTDLRKDGKNCLDIHYCFFLSAIHQSEPTEEIWARAVHMEKGGIQFEVPCPEDSFLLVLTTALHDFLTGSRKGPIIWLADCIDLAERYPLSYEDIVLQAERCSIRQNLSAAMLLLQYFLPGAFPELVRLVGEPTQTVLWRLGRMLDYKSLDPMEYKKFPARKRFSYRLRGFNLSYLRQFPLDTPMRELLRKYPAVFMSHFGISSAAKLPAEFFRRIKKWNQERKQ